MELEAACIIRTVSNGVQALGLTVVSRSSFLTLIYPEQIASNSYPEETSNMNIWSVTMVQMYQRCNSELCTVREL